MVLLPSPDTRLVPTHQVQWRMENSGLVIHIFPVDKSLQEEAFRAQIRELLERQISIHEVLVRINSITKVSQWRVFHCFTFPQACWTGTHLYSTRKWSLYYPLARHWHSSPRSRCSFNTTSNVALTQLLHAFQYLAHLHEGCMEPIR